MKLYQIASSGSEGGMLMRWQVHVDQIRGAGGVRKTKSFHSLAEAWAYVQAERLLGDRFILGKEY